MLMIRLQRVGRVNVPTFRLVLTDSKNSTKSGKFLEVLGMYDAVKNVKEVKADRVKYWMSQGAQLSDTVHNWLLDKKVISGKKINALPKKKPIKKDEPKGDAAKPAAAPAAPAAEPAKA
jgi:small subunit ribosomal protein S16